GRRQRDDADAIGGPERRDPALGGLDHRTALRLEADQVDDQDDAASRELVLVGADVELGLHLARLDARVVDELGRHDRAGLAADLLRGHGTRGPRCRAPRSRAIEERRTMRSRESAAYHADPGRAAPSPVTISWQRLR